MSAGPTRNPLETVQLVVGFFDAATSLPRSRSESPLLHTYPCGLWPAELTRRAIKVYNSGGINDQTKKYYDR